MELKDLLTRAEFSVDEHPLVGVDPTVRFAIMATPQGPERVDSAYRKVCVTVGDWQAQGVDANEQVLRVLLEASASTPLNLSSPEAVNAEFWVRQRGWQGLLLNPGHRARVLIPDLPLICESELVPMTCVVLVGPHAGFYVIQGDRRGVLSNRASSLLKVQFAVV